MRNKFLKSLKILLVEDEEKLSLLLKNAIGDNFHSFLLAKDGNEGLEFYKKVLPDIVITDIMMPNKTGLEMAKEIKTINPNSKIIILSAFSETDKFLSAIDVGVVKYFIKPFDPDELLAYINSLEDLFGQRSVVLQGEYIFHKAKKALYKKSKYIALTKNERVFLALLIQHYEEGKGVVSYDTIKKLLWIDEASDERLRTFVRRFRDKTTKELIKNVKGEGYQLLIA
ncbi:response regulator transcription factor [Sulfurimonas sp.]